MKRSTSASAQRAVSVVDITDPTAANTGIELLDLDAVQLQSMPLQVRRAIIRLESTAVVYLSTNVRVRTRTSVRAGLLAYVTFGPQARGTVGPEYGVSAASVPVRAERFHDQVMRQLLGLGIRNAVAREEPELVAHLVARLLHGIGGIADQLEPGVEVRRHRGQAAPALVLARISGPGEAPVLRGGGDVGEPGMSHAAGPPGLPANRG